MKKRFGFPKRSGSPRDCRSQLAAIPHVCLEPLGPIDHRLAEARGGRHPVPEPVLHPHSEQEQPHRHRAVQYPRRSTDGAGQPPLRWIFQ